jgi:hypothetical protein
MLWTLISNMCNEAEVVALGVGRVWGVGLAGRFMFGMLVSLAKVT